jgi:hypothetical protein
MRLSALLYEAFAGHLETGKAFPHSPAGVDEVSPALAYIEDSLADDLSLPALGALCGFSPATSHDGSALPPVRVSGSMCGSGESPAPPNF